MNVKGFLPFKLTQAPVRTPGLKVLTKIKVQESACVPACACVYVCVCVKEKEKNKISGVHFFKDKVILTANKHSVIHTRTQTNTHISVILSL